MSKKRVFISFDYDHDETQKDYLVGQARNKNRRVTEPCLAAGCWGGGTEGTLNT